MWSRATVLVKAVGPPAHLVLNSPTATELLVDLLQCEVGPAQVGHGQRQQSAAGRNSRPWQPPLFGYELIADRRPLEAPAMRKVRVSIVILAKQSALQSVSTDCPRGH
jgi:hypothetical protein